MDFNGYIYTLSLRVANINRIQNINFSKRFAHFGWYVGIKKNGRGKNGRKTWYPWGQNAIRFIARTPYAQPHPIKQLTNRRGLTLIIRNDGFVKGNC